MNSAIACCNDQVEGGKIPRRLALKPRYFNDEWYPTEQFLLLSFFRHAVGIMVQKVLSVRFQNMLHWLFSSAHLLDVENLKRGALVALVILLCRMSSSLHLHATMLENLLTVLAPELLVIHATMHIKPKSEDQVCWIRLHFMESMDAFLFIGRHQIFFSFPTHFWVWNFSQLFLLLTIWDLFFYFIYRCSFQRVW